MAYDRIDSGNTYIQYYECLEKSYQLPYDREGKEKSNI